MADIRLNDVRQIHRMLQRVANEIYDEKLPIERGKAIAYILNIMLKSAELKDIVTRLDKLEEIGGS